LGSDDATICDIAAARDNMAEFGIDEIHRAFDFAAAAIGLALFAPILLATSIAIKLDSRCPVVIR
jgi:lipopolysaccharide/colanic/teichoic acid biosynthesis glycosyltransferase